MGICPLRSASIFLTSTSTQITSLPKSASPAPVTRPTYPVPITAMSTGDPPGNIAPRTADAGAAHPTTLVPRGAEECLGVPRGGFDPLRGTPRNSEALRGTDYCVPVVSVTV